MLGATCSRCVGGQINLISKPLRCTRQICPQWRFTVDSYTWTKARQFHTSRVQNATLGGNPTDEEKKSNELVTEKFFKVQTDDDKNKESFQGAIDIFTHRDSRKRGTVEFIYAALRNMEKFGVHRDLQSYKKLLDVFPKGKMVPDNRLMADFFYYPKQQQCAVDLLVQMELNKLIPDEEMGDMLLNIFGKYSIPFKKFCRMRYWLTKLKNVSPWPLPFELPNDALELAKIAIKRITSVDPLTKIDVLNTEDVEQATDKTWIVSGQSPDQAELIRLLPDKTALYVEGAFRVWLEDKQVNYFILRGPPRPPPPAIEYNDSELSEITLWIDGVISSKDKGNALDRRMHCVHEQDDGTLLAVCATGSSSRESLLSWIRCLEKDNPRLSEMAVLFTLQSPLGPVIPVDDSKNVAKT